MCADGGGALGAPGASTALKMRSRPREGASGSGQGSGPPLGVGVVRETCLVDASASLSVPEVVTETLSHGGVQ